MVARYGAAFQMQVLAHDPHPARPPEGVELVSLQQLLNRADILTLHASFDDSTRGLIDARALALTKRGVLLVNTARGEILEETALLDALRRGQVAAAALDVLGGEPFADPGALRAHPLWQWAQTHPNLILTPHMGGAAVESMARTEVFMAEKLRKWLNAPAPRS
jgi:D-3-phosphoglycerate dehydrogenase